MAFAFHDGHDPKPPTARRPSQDAFHLAACHRNWVRKRGWAVSRDKTLWAAAAQPLVTQIGFNRCGDVLTWYHAQFDRPKPAFGLRLFTIKDFVKFFNLIEAVKEKDVPVLKDHPLLNTVLPTLTRHAWPDGQSLHTAVNLSLHTVDTVLHALRTLDTRSVVVKRAAKHLVTEIGPPRAFVLRWFENVWEDVRDWKAWGGSLKPHTIASHRSDCFAGWMEEILIGQMGGKQADMVLDDLQQALDAEFLK